MDEPRTRDKRPLRQRVSKACDVCRSRKDRCDGKKPSCSPCIKLGRACCYNTESKKRGLKEGYVRGLERLWALSIRRIPGLEDQVLQLVGEGTQEGTQQAFVGVWSATEEGRSLLKSWRKSRVHGELDNLLQVLDSLPEKLPKEEILSVPNAPLPAVAREPEASQDRTTSYPKSDLEDTFPHPHLIQESDAFEPQDSGQFQASEHPLNSAKAVQEPLPGIKQLPPGAWNLVEMYFSYTQVWLPILEKHDVLRVLYQYTQDILPSSPVPESGEQAALWAMLAYAGVQYSTLKKNPSDIVHVDLSGPTAEEMYKHARSLIPIVSPLLTINHIQALLLLVLTDIWAGNWNQAWITVGHAARASIMLGLDGIPAAVGDESKESKTRNKHVFLGCFVLDTIISSRLGRRPQLRKRDLRVIGSLDEKGLDEWDPWKRDSSLDAYGPCFAASTFNGLVDISRFMNDIVSVREQPSTIPSPLAILYADFRKWNERQSPMLQIDPNTHPSSIRGQTTILPHQYHMRLAHISALLRIHAHQGIVNAVPEVVSLVGQGCLLLEQHATSFGCGVLPPTYEFFACCLSESLNTVLMFGAEIHTIREELWGLKRSAANIADVWPAFRLLRDRINEISERAFGNHIGLSAIGSLEQLPQEATPLLTESSIFEPPNSTLHTLKRPGDYIHRKKQSLLADQDTVNLDHFSLDKIVPSKRMAFESQAPSRLAPIPAQMRTSPTNNAPDSAGSPMDSIFHDFATIDATEWMNNWDESLANLGFADRASMDQEFQTFWRDMNQGQSIDDQMALDTGGSRTADHDLPQ